MRVVRGVITALPSPPPQPQRHGDPNYPTERESSRASLTMRDHHFNIIYFLSKNLAQGYFPFDQNTAVTRPAQGTGIKSVKCTML